MNIQIFLSVKFCLFCFCQFLLLLIDNNLQIIHSVIFFSNSTYFRSIIDSNSTLIISFELSFHRFFLTMNLIITFSQFSIFLVDYVFQIIDTIVRINLIAFNDRTQPLPQPLSQPDIRLSFNLQID